MREGLPTSHPEQVFDPNSPAAKNTLISLWRSDAFTQQERSLYADFVLAPRKQSEFLATTRAHGITDTGAYIVTEIGHSRRVEPVDLTKDAKTGELPKDISEKVVVSLGNPATRIVHHGSSTLREKLDDIEEKLLKAMAEPNKGSLLRTFSAIKRDVYRELEVPEDASREEKRKVYEKWLLEGNQHKTEVTPPTTTIVVFSHEQAIPVLAANRHN